MSASGDLPGWADLTEAERLAIIGQAAVEMNAERGAIEEDSIVIDEHSGDTGIVREVYDDDALVYFPDGTADTLMLEGLSLAADQSWEPEGGWPR